MERLAAITAETLRQSNRTIKEVLSCLEPGSTCLADMPERLMELSRELWQNRAWVEAGSDVPASDELRREIEEYRKLLRLLQRALPNLESWLLVERERLSRERSHVEAAERWAAASKGTL